MNRISKTILIAAVIVFVLVLALLSAEGGSGEIAEVFGSRFGVVSLVGSLGFLAIIVYFTNSKK